VARLSTFALLALAAGSLLGTPAAAGRLPYLASAAPRNGHVLVAFSLGDLAPGELVVATSSRVSANGALTTGIELDEALKPSATPGTAHWRSRKTLRRGRYFVQVSGIDTGGVTDCMPRQRGCGQDWSNIRRLVVQG